LVSGYERLKEWERHFQLGKRHSEHIMLGLVRAGIAGDRSSGDLLSASCNLQLSYAEDPSCHQHIALSTNRLRIEYDEHAERTYIAENDEGPNTSGEYCFIHISCDSLAFGCSLLLPPPSLAGKASTPHPAVIAAILHYIPAHI
jgi:hypothetical protein